MARVVRRGHVNGAEAGTGEVVRRGHVNTAPQDVVTDADVEAAVDEAIEEIESSVTTIALALEAQQTVFTAEVRLPKHRRAGAVVIEHEATFEDAQIGAPLIVGAAPHQGAIETIVFAGEVLNARQVRLHWSAPGPVPSRVRVNYVIGHR